MNALALLERYYPPGDPAREILFLHSRAVADKAVAVARRLAAAGEPVDIAFVEEAALLHDIGIRYVHAPRIGCTGSLSYLTHGCKGREILEAEGLPRHALVCERHIGVGLTTDDIRRNRLPIPEHDMRPLTLEEEIVTYADLFFSKNPDAPLREKSPDEIRHGLARFGSDKVAIFDAWHRRFAPQGN